MDRGGDKVIEKRVYSAVCRKIEPLEAFERKNRGKLEQQCDGLLRHNG